MVGLISRRIFSLGSTVLVGGSLLFSACSTPPLQRICEDEFPLYDRRLEDAVAIFRPPLEPGLLSTPAGRSLASTAVPPPAVISLSEEDQRRWLSWSESQLWGIQSVLLTTPTMTSSDRRIAVRKALNRVANLLVMFHGHADRRDAEAMLRLLERMKEPQTAARAGLCQVDPL